MGRKRPKQEPAPAVKRPKRRANKRRLADMTIDPWEAQVWQDKRKGRKP